MYGQTTFIGKNRFTWKINNKSSEKIIIIIIIIGMTARCLGLSQKISEFCFSPSNWFPFLYFCDGKFLVHTTFPFIFGPFSWPFIEGSCIKLPVLFVLILFFYMSFSSHSVQFYWLDSIIQCQYVFIQRSPSSSNNVFIFGICLVKKY